MTPLPGCTPTKPGSACFPFFGVLPVILDEDGKVITAPPNIKTNPPKTGTQYIRTTFSPIAPFMPDDYDYPRIVRRKEFE